MIILSGKILIINPEIISGRVESKKLMKKRSGADEALKFSLLMSIAG